MGYQYNYCSGAATVTVLNTYMSAYSLERHMEGSCEQFCLCRGMDA